MKVQGRSHVKVSIKLEGAEQYVNKNGELVTEVSWEQYINDDGTQNVLRFAWGNTRTASGRFSSKLSPLGTWTDSDLPAGHREAILKAFSREQGNIARISSL